MPLIDFWSPGNTTIVAMTSPERRSYFAVAEPIQGSPWSMMATRSARDIACAAFEPAPPHREGVRELSTAGAQ
jgi:hypothetical protein